MQRDHMMGWVMPAEPLGPAKSRSVYSKAARAEIAEYVAEKQRLRDFETGDHMLPGMRKKDFPKEYDTRVAIESLSKEAYDRVVREHREWFTGDFGFDEGRPGGDMSAVCVRDSRGHTHVKMFAKPYFKKIIW